MRERRFDEASDEVFAPRCSFLAKFLESFFTFFD